MPEAPHALSIQECKAGTVVLRCVVAMQKRKQPLWKPLDDGVFPEPVRDALARVRADHLPLRYVLPEDDGGDDGTQISGPGLQQHHLASCSRTSIPSVGTARIGCRIRQM